MKNAPATLKRTMDIILAPVRWQTCLVYLDDFIIFSKSRAQHLRDVYQVLSLLRVVGAFLKLAKCSFFADSVNYLVHKKTPGKLQVAEKNTTALRLARHQTTETQLRSFLGLCIVYRRFVPGFAKLAAPLTDLLKKIHIAKLQPLRPPEVAAFDSLRSRLLSRPFKLFRSELAGSLSIRTSPIHKLVAAFFSSNRMASPSPSNTVAKP